jgi:hypothetical protein
MVEQAALGNGPIEITDANGALVSIPVSALFFDSGTLKARGTRYAANKAAFDALLAYLALEGIVKPSAVAVAAAPAAVVTAKKKGKAGNDIQVVIANPRQDPADNTRTIFDATVTQTDRYRDISPLALEDLLGGSATTGSLANAVFLQSTSSTAASGATPATIVLPKVGVVAATGATAEATVPRATGAGNAFKLRFRNPDTAAVMTVEITDVAATTFGMVVTWTKSVTGIAIGDLGTTANFGNVIDVAGPPPAGGTPTIAPAAGTVVLTGGADAAAATNAAGTVLAASA